MASLYEIQQAQEAMERTLEIAQRLDMEKRKALAQSRMRNLSTVVSSETTVMGKFLVNGPGEGYKDIEFPVVFEDVPFMTFGFEIQDNNATSTVPGFSGVVVKGQAPIITAAIYDWNVRENPPFGRKFMGASILSTCEGPLTTKYMVHWMATGIALGGPAIEQGSTAGASTDLEEGNRASIMWSPGQAGWFEGNWYTANQTPPGYGS
jgi:hypothetical protein